MNKHLLDRRQFNALCAAVGLSFPGTGAMIGALSGASVLAGNAPSRTVRLQNSTIVPAIGQGSWHLGQGRHPAGLEEEALRTGISLGMSLEFARIPFERTPSIRGESLNRACDRFVLRGNAMLWQT